MVNQLACFLFGTGPLHTFFFLARKNDHSHIIFVTDRLQVELFHLIWWGHILCRFWDLNVWTSGCSLNGILRGLQGYSEETCKGWPFLQYLTLIMTWLQVLVLHGNQFAPTLFDIRILIGSICIPWCSPFVDVYLQRMDGSFSTDYGFLLDLFMFFGMVSLMNSFFKTIKLKTPSILPTKNLPDSWFILRNLMGFKVDVPDRINADPYEQLGVDGVITVVSWGWFRLQRKFHGKRLSLFVFVYI